MVIRFQGRANASHTIICGYSKFALHQLPSGVFYPHTTNIIGNGVALDVPKLVDELKTLADGGVPTPHHRGPAHPGADAYHVLQDVCEEAAGRRGLRLHPSRGIAPFYADKYAKMGVQVRSLRRGAAHGPAGACLRHQDVLFEHLYHKPPWTQGRSLRP